MISENDFFVAIQGLFETVANQGWSRDKIEACMINAFDEFAQEVFGDEADEWENDDA